MPPPTLPQAVTVGEALLWLESVQRACGPDVPLWLVTQDRQHVLAVAPAVTLRLDCAPEWDHATVVYVVGLGVEIAPSGTG